MKGVHIEKRVGHQADAQSAIDAGGYHDVQHPSTRNLFSPMTSPSPDVVIIGGGIVGCAAAWYLSQTGVRVQVIEQHRVGAHASGGSAGILSPSGEPEPTGALCRLGLETHAAIAPQLLEQTRIDVEFQREGVLVPLLPEEMPPRDRERSPETQWLDAAELRDLEPGLAPNFAGAWYFPQEGQVNTGRLTHALAEGAARYGATFCEGVSVVGLRRDGERVTGVRTTAGNISAQAVVLAAGAWSGTLGDALGVPLPVYPVKGQIVWAQARPIPVRRPVFALGYYLVPKPEMGIAIGATIEDAGFSETPTLAATSTLIDAAIQTCPTMAEATLLRAWAGVRPASGDGIPFLGPVPSMPGLILATGHFREGILMGPITGQLVANWVLGRPQPLDMRAFGVERDPSRAYPSPSQPPSPSRGEGGVTGDHLNARDTPITERQRLPSPSRGEGGAVAGSTASTTRNDSPSNSLPSPLGGSWADSLGKR